MPLPAPVPGLVIRYSYLWASEYRRGQEEGTKDRPCAVVLATTDDSGQKIVTVLPISHALPTDPGLAVEIPPATKRRLTLDDERSWVVLTEANRFAWPGPDLRPLIPGDFGERGLRAFAVCPFRRNPREIHRCDQSSARWRHSTQ